MGRMLEAEEICEGIEACFQPKLLKGRRVLITAGPTFESIDTVRGITNISSGKMGYAVARAARDAGAAVTLVSGPTALGPPRGIERIDVSSAREMHDAVMAHVARADVFIGVAAVADYRPQEAKPHKLKKGSGTVTLELRANPDILATVAARKRPPFCVGFAAETENLEAYAAAKRKRKNVPLLAANLAQHAFGADDNQLVLFDDQGKHELARAPKIVLARQLIAHIARMLPKK
jgi:phosphopantothenoylcysteine decarboxylase/phosphopantothenate--cysteine ligase